MPKNQSKFIFSPDVAQKYGVQESIILEYIAHWVKISEKSGRQFDGCSWTFGSIRHISKAFPFWSEKQVRRILLSLEKQGAIRVGRYNKRKYDRTKWYTLTDEVLPFYQMGKPIPLIKNKDIKSKKSLTIDTPRFNPI